MSWWSVLSRCPGIKIIKVREEGAGLAMAEGWAKSTGKTGVCSVTHGPGVSRMTTSLIAATRSRTPIVVYTSKTVFNNENIVQFLDQEKLVNASSGFDIPPFESFMDFKAWETVEPPKYTVYNFPPRRDVIPHLTGFPAPLKIGTQMWAQATMCKMIAQHTQSGMSAKDSISWAESELESYMRT